MSKYQHYRNRVTIDGATMRDVIKNSTKRLQHANLMNSPSLSYVKVNSEEYPCIVSDIDTFKKRRFLFLPDTIVEAGSYIELQNLTYLVTEYALDDIYPQSIGELCNDTFDLVITTERIKVDEDVFGRPIYDTIDKIESIPCVVSTKTYSTAENNPIPLPDGSMTIKLPYKPDREIPLNYVIEKRGQQYQVTSVSYENVLNEVGFIEITLQRVVSGNES